MKRQGMKSDYTIAELIEIGEEMKRKFQVLVDAELDCECKPDSDKETNLVRCPKHAGLDIINRFETAVKNAEPRAFNNSYISVQFVDAFAFAHVLAHQGVSKSNGLHSPQFVRIGSHDPKWYLYAQHSRYAMDGNGYHVGYEEVLVKWNLIPKSDFNIINCPRNVSAFVIHPHEFELVAWHTPPDEPTEHMDDCKYANSKRYKNNFDNCDCADNWNGYSPPEKDFFEDEVDNAIRMILEYDDLPVAEFNMECEMPNGEKHRVWTLGDYGYHDMDWNQNPQNCFGKPMDYLTKAPRL